jgi:HEPN domain-containing protein
MTTDFSNSSAILATVTSILEAEGLTPAATVLKTADARFEKTGYDNWNGGTDLYTLFLQIDAGSFARLGQARDELEQQITERLKPVIDGFSDDWVSAQIRPRVENRAGWKSMGQGGLTEITRRDIRDYFTVSEFSWWGDLDETEFLSRLYDLATLPSHDHRFKDAAGDIWQHRSNNDDWSDDWVFEDGRFGLAESDEKLLRFLAETLHPAVRRDRTQISTLVGELNKRLNPDGWELAEAEMISGRPCYAAQRLRSGAVRAVTRARAVADALDAGWMRREIQRLERAIDADPSLAVGTAKELVETCCKTILNRQKVDYPKGSDLPKLVKLVATELKLVPEGISEAAKGADVIRGILRNLATITQGLAELRGLYGTGHGRDGKYRGLGPRHARLAVASAVAFIDFVTETYHDRQG